MNLAFVTLLLGLVTGVHPVELKAGASIKALKIFLDQRELASMTAPPWRTTIDFGPALVAGQLYAIGYDGGGKEIARASQVINVPQRAAAATSDSVGATPVILHVSGEQPVANCFAPLRVSAVEKASSLAVFVLDPSVSDAHHAFILDSMHEVVDAHDVSAVGGDGLAEAPPVPRPPNEPRGLADDTTVRIIWTVVAERASRASASGSDLFVRSPDMPARKENLITLLNTEMIHGPVPQPRRPADAVAAAGVSAAGEARRRAVVLVLDAHKDKSHASPLAVRSYLASIDVPLFVWSLTGPRPDLAATWGAVEDVSSREKLEAAAARLRNELASQRVVWLVADPRTALRARPSESCGVTTANR